MSFLEQSQRVLEEVYRTFGIDATYTSASQTQTITLIQEKNYVVESGEMLVYKVRTSELASVSLGDTIEIEGKTREIINFDQSEDGLELYIGVAR